MVERAAEQVQGLRQKWARQYFRLDGREEVVRRPMGAIFFGTRGP